MDSQSYMDHYHWVSLKGIMDREYDRLLKVSQMTNRSGESIGYPFTEFERGVMDVWCYWRDK